ncbi:MAG: hypothetical protein IKF52_00270 [Clostridia bacterium]|nr:hypothetical protein [Clostridia bacterium]
MGSQLFLNYFQHFYGLFLSISLLRISGIIDLISDICLPFLNLVNMPKELLSLCVLRPVSGSSTIAIATDIMKVCGTDSKVGLMTSTIMGSTETTLYTIAVYSSKVKTKKIKDVLIIALLGDCFGMVLSIVIWNLIIV